MPPRARIKACCASAHGRDAPPITISNLGPEWVLLGRQKAGRRRRSRGGLSLGVWRFCQCPTGARLRDKGEGCSGPHLPHVLRPNRRPHNLACPPLEGPASGIPEDPANGGSARPWPHLIARCVSRGAPVEPSASLLYAPGWTGPAGIGTPSTKPSHPSHFTHVLCSWPATVALRTAPPRAVPDQDRGHRIASHRQHQFPDAACPVSLSSPPSDRSQMLSRRLSTGTGDVRLTERGGLLRHLVLVSGPAAAAASKHKQHTIMKRIALDSSPMTQGAEE